MTHAPEEKTRTLQEWRAIKGYSKSYVARYLGVHPSTYARIEDHPEGMTIETAMKLENLFGCKVRQIIFFTHNSKFKLELSQSS